MTADKADIFIANLDQITSKLMTADRAIALDIVLDMLQTGVIPAPPVDPDNPLYIRRAIGFLYG